jgi:hypothetical protein
MFSKAVGLVAGFLVIVFGIGWAAEGNDFFMYKFFAPKQEAVRRQTFEESKAYNDGMAEEISAMQLDYVKANPEQKAALRSVIIHRTAGYDVSRLNPDLRAFVESVRHEALTVAP